MHDETSVRQAEASENRPSAKFPLPFRYLRGALAVSSPAWTDGTAEFTEHGYSGATTAAPLAESLGGNSDASPELTVRVSFAAVLGCVRLDDWLFPDGVSTPDAIDRASIAFVLNGITAHNA